MATVEMSGSEWLLDAATAIADLPLANYIRSGGLAGEEWNTVTFDDEASSTNLAWKSAEGSTIKLVTASTGTDESGTDKGTTNINSKYSGIKIDGKWNDVWSGTSSNHQESFSVTYTGDSSVKDDDYTYSFIDSNQKKWSDTATGLTGTWTEKSSLQFSNAQYAYKFSWSGTGSYTWSNEAQDTTSVIYSGMGSYSFKDSVNNISLNMSVKQSQNKSLDQDKWDLTSVKYVTADVSVTTNKFSKTVAFESFAELGEIAHPTGDFDLISSNIPSFNEIMLEGDNTISITTKSGAEIHAGAGNDKITGGTGHDTIAAGAGKDSISGGKGNDVFILSKDDYVFTSTKTLLADTISDFKYVTNGEQDSLTLDGFADVAVYKTLALAKAAKATEEVIYESGTGKLWYNTDDSGALLGIMNFATVKGIPDSYWATMNML